MSRSTLLRRLEHLEYQLPPKGEPLVIQVCFVSPEGVRTKGPRIVIAGSGSGRSPGRGRHNVGRLWR